MRTKKKLTQFLKNIDFRNITNWGKFCIIIVILFSVISSSIQTGYESYLSFYEKGNDPLFDTFRSFLWKQKTYQVFLTYSGLNTGYGFFSPNVSSDFIITHKLYSEGQEELIFSNSMFKTKEGAMRFTNINSLYMDRIDEIENDSIQLDSLRSKYLDMILNRMNAEQLKNTAIDSVKTSLFLYHFPFLKEYPNVTPKFITIENHSKARKTI